MKKLLCLLLTLLLIHPALAEDALDAPDVTSLLSCADGTVLAVSADLRVLRRDTAGDWALILSAEQISAACPPRFMPDAANVLLLPGENGAYALLLLPDTSGQIAVLSLTGATCELTRVFADFLPTDSEMTAQWALLSAARRKHAVRCLFKQFRDIQHLCAFAGGRVVFSAFGCADSLLDALGGRAAAGVRQSAHKQHRRKLLRPAGCGFRRIQPPLRPARPQGIRRLRAGRRFPLFHRWRDDLLHRAAL